MLTPSLARKPSFCGMGLLAIRMNRQQVSRFEPYRMGRQRMGRSQRLKEQGFLR